MHRLTRSALLSCSVERMFNVINDIERYPEFLPYCVGASVRPESGNDEQRSVVLASLHLSARGFSEQFTTRNMATAHERVEIQLVSGPFSSFHGVWTLSPIGEQGCRTDLAVQFEFRRGLRLLSHIVRGSLMHSADKVLDAFCKRAESAPLPPRGFAAGG